ncbi:hypothetical protein M8C13_01810 [Crossiella sp. SN42]|uniref:hypothetical protein n=1 Tax=Crossiella sp. SN42 TaxID=2944808 RepID=UPI00207CF06B|nr:hypothetical protein [Crossiella sp. SN42]MCO1574492.1 hypothetical protein [Crossiella sp. SN42]
MTTSPDGARCAGRARWLDEVDGVLECARPAGHPGAHRAHVDPVTEVSWREDQSTSTKGLVVVDWEPA